MLIGDTVFTPASCSLKKPLPKAASVVGLPLSSATHCQRESCQSNWRNSSAHWTKESKKYFKSATSRVKVLIKGAIFERPTNGKNYTDAYHEIINSSIIINDNMAVGCTSEPMLCIMSEPAHPAMRPIGLAHPTEPAPGLVPRIGCVNDNTTVSTYVRSDPQNHVIHYFHDSTPILDPRASLCDFEWKASNPGRSTVSNLSQILPPVFQSNISTTLEPKDEVSCRPGGVDPYSPRRADIVKNVLQIESLNDVSNHYRCENPTSLIGSSGFSGTKKNSGCLIESSGQSIESSGRSIESSGRFIESSGRFIESSRSEECMESSPKAFEYYVLVPPVNDTVLLASLDFSESLLRRNHRRTGTGGLIVSRSQQRQHPTSFIRPFECLGTTGCSTLPDSSFVGESLNLHSNMVSEKEESPGGDIHQSQIVRSALARGIILVRPASIEEYDLQGVILRLVNLVVGKIDKSGKSPVLASCIAGILGVGRVLICATIVSRRI